MDDAKEKYKTADCTAALISTEARITEVMAGAGLECQRCGFFGDAAPPKWIIALNAPKGKSGDEIQVRRGTHAASFSCAALLNGDAGAQSRQGRARGR